MSTQNNLGFLFKFLKHKERDPYVYLKSFLKNIPYLIIYFSHTCGFSFSTIL